MPLAQTLDIPDQSADSAPLMVGLKTRLTVLIVLAFSLLSGCASLPLDEARQAFRQGDYAAATKILDSEDIKSRDRLLALVEKALIQHVSGDYEQSSQTFLKAAAYLEERDYISVGEQSASLAVNEWVTTYKGEYSERLWIHTYQMMNFLLLNRYESAAVEARQALKVYDQFPGVLDDDFYTRALIALVFEKNGLDNDAVVEYRKLGELLPDALPIALPFAKSARRSGNSELATQYLSLAQTETAEYQRVQPLNNENSGELVLMIASGNVPHKVAGDVIVSADTRISFPVYQGDYYLNPPLSIFHNEERLNIPSVSTALGTVATEALSTRAKTIATKQIVRLGIKHAIVAAVESESETGALLLNAAFFLLEEADTRSWQSLPARLKLLRIRLPAGQHSIAISSANRLGKTDPVVTLDNLEIQAGQTIFRKIRYATGYDRGYYRR